jgi:hypothetical protein
MPATNRQAHCGKSKYSQETLALYEMAELTIKFWKRKVNCQCREMYQSTQNICNKAPNQSIRH